MRETARVADATVPSLSLAVAREEAERLARAGSWSEAAERLLALGDACRRHAACATLLAESLLRAGRAREARAWLAGVLPMLSVAEDRPSYRRGTLLWGAAHFELGELESAHDAFAAALELGRADDDHLLVARATNNLALIANIHGNWREALALYQLALSGYQRLGHARGLAECYHNMAITYRDVGRLEEADELEQRCVEFARESRTPALISFARLGRAELALRRGDPSLAEASARRVAREFADAGDPVREADALRLAGIACTATARHDDARALLDAALAIAREQGALLSEAETLRARADLAEATGDGCRANEDARAALALFERLQARAECEALRERIARG